MARSRTTGSSVPDSSRFVLPIARPDRAWPRRGRRHPRPDRPARRPEPPGLDLRRARQHRGRAGAAQRAGDQLIAKLLLAAIALVVGVGGIWLLFIGVSALVEPAAAEDGATGSCPGSSSSRRWSLLAVFLVYPAVGDDPRAASRTTTGAFTLANCKPRHADVPRDPAQQRHLADRRHRRQRGARPPHRRAVRPRPARVAGQDLRLPAAGDLARRRDRSSGASSTPGSPPASRRSDCSTRSGRPSAASRSPGCTTSPINIFARDRDPDLAPDRLRHGRPLGRDQGRVDARSSRRPGSMARSERQLFFAGDRADRSAARSSRSPRPSPSSTLKIFDIVYVDRPADATTTTSSRTGCSRRSSSSSTTDAPRRWRRCSSSPSCR